jgi:hypothetical protein
MFQAAKSDRQGVGLTLVVVKGEQDGKEVTMLRVMAPIGVYLPTGRGAGDRRGVIGLWVMIRKRVSGALQHGGEQVAEALDIIVVERRVDLVEDADRRRVGEEHGEDQRQRRQRLLAARQQRQHLLALARRVRQSSSPASSGSSDSTS